MIIIKFKTIKSNKKEKNPISINLKKDKKIFIRKIMKIALNKNMIKIKTSKK